MMIKRKIYFVELVEVSAAWLLYLKRAGFRWPKSVLINILIVVMSLSFVILNGNKSNNGAVINHEIFPGRTMSDMGSGEQGGGQFIASITLPGDGAMFAAPANITIYAGAINVGGNIARLDFMADDALLYSSEKANYAFTWKGAPAGQYVLTVRATNYKGETTTSLPANITVIDPTETGCTCAADCNDRTDISPPFSIDGAGEHCWEATSLGSHVLSWNLDTLLINGVGLRNRWTNKLPAPINGRYFIYYKSSNEFGHFEMK